MSWDNLFGTTNAVALVAWAVLIFAPRGVRLVDFVVRFGVPGALAVCYAPASAWV